MAQVLSHFSVSLSTIVHFKLEDQLKEHRQWEDAARIPGSRRHVTASEDRTGEMAAEASIYLVGHPAPPHHPSSIENSAKNWGSGGIFDTKFVIWAIWLCCIAYQFPVRFKVKRVFSASAADAARMIFGVAGAEYFVYCNRKNLGKNAALSITPNMKAAGWSIQAREPGYWAAELVATVIATDFADYGGKYYMVNSSGGLETKPTEGHPLGATGLAMHFTITNTQGKCGFVQNIGLGGAVVVSLLVAQHIAELYHADSPDGRDSGGPFSIPGDSSSGATSHHIREISLGRRKKQKSVCAQDGSHTRYETTIDMLPDNVLLQIFDSCRERSKFLDAIHFVWDWHFLVHVCRRWRRITFESPQRLNLRILCTDGTPVRKNLGIWPALPIVIDYHNALTYPKSGITPDDEDDIVAALEHPDRVSYLGLNVTGSQLDKMATVMQEPFSVLTCLVVISSDGNAPVLPTEFLGGSAPCLQYIVLNGIPFPALPTLLLSASDLLWLHLLKVPATGYISPKAMVACLAVLPRLERFIIAFQLATSRPDRISPPPVTRTVLPALTFFGFKGASEYLEDLIAQIDSPQLDQIRIDYLNQSVDIQVAQLSEFVDRSVGPKLTQFRRAGITFSSDHVSFEMYRHGIRPTSARTSILCQGIDWQVSHIAQVLSHVSGTLSNVVHLKFAAVDTHPEQLEDTDDIEWPHLLRRFTSVKTLYVSQEIARHVALALEAITGETVTEVLPSLDLICLVGQPASSVEKFITTRRLSGFPLTVVNTETEFAERLKLLKSHVTK
ncbi:hypothetical protein EDB92DRAFT_1952999 [Lactarius akahatsu]|uniref:F-box domain-containing protein n=1 Tax=Lactarius akahatsu TaxID=416441 RepID=A0AAD4L5Z9_9AGAM|nr:hypothetical protein EDB92DRAFT_1952999 [Lactarius akahatsu]